MSDSQIVKQMERGGFVARIFVDENPESPENWDRLGTIAYMSTRYKLGYERVTKEGMDEIRDKISSGEYIGMPVYAYVHSGATVRAANSNPFTCQFDSGQCGFVYCTKEAARKEFPDANPALLQEEALKRLIQEVATFDQYLQGDVYRYALTDKDGDVVDSCGGFYGRKHVEEEVTAILDYHAGAQKDLFEGHESADTKPTKKTARGLHV